MKCKNCKFFKREENSERGNCKSDKFFYAGMLSDRKVKNDELEYRDFESYSAGFDVGENFGCIHYKNSQGKD